MKLNYKKHLLKLTAMSMMVGSAGVWWSCTDKFEEMNTSKTKLTTLGKDELPFLFSRAEQQASYAGGTYQIAQNLFADLYAQYFATSATYFPSDRYVMRFDWLTGHWNPIYTQVVPQLKTLLNSTDANSSENALANIMWVFAFHRLTDYYGPIPYFDAGEPARTVKYDPQDKIYEDFFKRLDAATTVLKGKTAEKPYGNFDLIYKGDVNKWIKFANTLRLRLALRISKVNPAEAKRQAEAAYAGGVMTDLSDAAFMVKNEAGNDHNGLGRIAIWNEFRMSASMESVLKGYEDPRIGIFFQPASATNTYEGLRNGLLPAQLNQAGNGNNDNSNVGRRWVTGGGSAWTSQLTVPQDIIHTSEPFFLRAEGALNGWNMGGTAQELYEKGIEMSMRQWGITDDAAIQAYINSSKTPVAPGDPQNSPALSNIPVKWESGAAEAVKREQIGTQKWLALYPDGIEAWAEFRRTRFPKLYPVMNSDNADLPAGSFIRRIPFLDLEKQTNGEAVKTAEGLLSGPDKASTPLWWDKN
ncbi:SusD/RagB family nutrient-binding outer membrane lipoprotein [Arundinibacter roseus]|uniref:SusD/RagB family nutrient-binding outer membrane lipoprotein n=1 Tax=Arundinibacter roseus TaxID=2070510 RepID=A0A4R4KED3_9BACT|nr:SusD/RagB family nutrient-binding outer membrane lipoprotein [Arundinibacter roseus]TDB65096.1 SusD/RagB family nutrient-binding outer membrane lipoprotein [Arundinibacter roseus]